MTGVAGSYLDLTQDALGINEVLKDIANSLDGHFAASHLHRRGQKRGGVGMSVSQSVS